ncbi:hypothetical protein Drose_35940 [Dactylosporangium roseum]|uniref:Microcin J25-processing protein McjB C-terminal domain-containing protein n=1 Tax=Dactylosporangium roseum TaxID=47989 RepID=A0ABY5Z2X6_9ACTN|nr:hypothetical protein [Dactylosporangium roseum]UWZ36369.1 hypothetical protein Drose_35940 [Dactylosporangium roseum]
MYPRGLNDDHETAVRAAASAFRAGLERGGLRMVSLAEFPKGSCGDACELLGQFLADSGLGDWQYRSGKRDEPFHTHAWLEQDGLILDITADQFPDIDEPVILTRDSGWHAQFQLMGGGHVANLGRFDGHDHVGDAQWTYAELVRRATEPPAA